MSSDMPDAQGALEISPIPACQDNDLWLLSHSGQAVVVDPGDAAPVEAELERRGLQLVAILITHHHPDHIGGLDAMLQKHSVPVYGPLAEHKTIPQLSVTLGDGDEIEVLGRRFKVMEVPGHTLGHIVYFAGASDLDPPILLCGDTLFSAGCGRLFEGTPVQMHHSLERLAELPGATQVYCTHEYTQANLAFANAVEPDNKDLAEYAEHVAQLRKAGKPSLPTSLELEKRVNPFLRVSQPSVVAAVKREQGAAPKDDVATFASLRRWKDNFKAPTA